MKIAQKLAQVLGAVLLVTGLTGCPRDEEEKPLTGPEARQALDESAFAAEAQALTAEEVEITTDFTLGAGARKAAENLRDFYQSQAPCAEVTLAEATVTINFGVEAGCTWRGRTWQGQHAIQIVKAEEGAVEVHHTWTDFTNGRVTLDGTAQVTWSLADKSRTVAHDLTWSRGDKVASGTGTSTQTLLEPALGLAGGLAIEGDRAWTGPAGGTWSLSMEGVEARPQDPVPQAGTYRLVTPNDKAAALIFERVDVARIRVTLTSAGKSFSFIVLANGQVEAA